VEIFEIWGEKEAQEGLFEDLRLLYKVNLGLGVIRMIAAKE